MESGKPAVVETLLGYGADVHVRGGRLRETPLHIAARVEDGDRCAVMLLKSGTGANLTTDDGQTPVHVAAKNGNLATLILLLEDGGDAMYKSNVSAGRLQKIFEIHCDFLCRTEKLLCIWHVEVVSRKS